jgi:hypothetical protein
VALKNTKWYVNYGNGSSTGYFAVGAWVANTAKSVGALIRATAPALNAERIFICIVAGTTHADTEPTWVTTKGAKTDDNDVDWMECTGQPAVNGDVTNTPPWEAAQATALGYIIKSTAATHYFICTTSSGNTGAGEPSWDTTTGNTTNDGSNVWTCIGAVGAFSGWGSPIPRLANAFTATWGVAGDTFYVSDAHAETQASAMTLTSPGTAAAPCRVLCVDDSAEPPTALATTATITVTGGSGNLTFVGACYVYGCTIKQSGSGKILFYSDSVIVFLYFDSCIVDMSSTNSGQAFSIGGASSGAPPQLVVFDNTIYNSAHANFSLSLNCKFIWKNTAATAVTGTIPTTLLAIGATFSDAECHVYGVNLSALGTGTYLVNVGVKARSRVTFENCKLGSSVSVVNGTIPSQAMAPVSLVNCDSGDTQTRYQKTVYQGSIYSETTIKRTGGASDATTGYSRKMVSSANSQFFSPLVLETIRIWNEGTSEMTATVHVVTDNVTLTNAECWMEVEYQGTSGYPLSVVDLDDRAADILATPANQATSTETWTTTGLSTPVYQKLESTFTPAEKGWIICRVMLAKASTTVYVCPKVELSTYSPSVQQMTPDGIVNSGEYPAVGTVQTDEVYRFNDLTGTYAGGGGGGPLIGGRLVR